MAMKPETYESLRNSLELALRAAKSLESDISDVRDTYASLRYQSPNYQMGIQEVVAKAQEVPRSLRNLIEGLRRDYEAAPER